ncbi:hypothetical protein GCM10009860_19150 [Microbacterium mitrae]
MCFVTGSDIWQLEGTGTKTQPQAPRHARSWFQCRLEPLPWFRRPSNVRYRRCTREPRDQMSESLARHAAQPAPVACVSAPAPTFGNWRAPEPRRSRRKGTGTTQRRREDTGTTQQRPQNAPAYASHQEDRHGSGAVGGDQHEKHHGIE